ncbi:hypothetical protein JTB14_026049 [Gonioctena quinquepunctata]|nr:hypothetical protein JTB14_026049 [Gonioctena quinquepunctata]
MADILPSGSEDENLSDSDDDYVPNPNTKDAVSSDKGDIYVSDSEDEEPLSNISARGKQKYTWTKVRGDQDNHNPQFTSQDIEEGPEMGRPIHYFEMFFSNQLLDLIVEQSNSYACQVDPNKPLNLTRSELRIFIGTIIYMSIFGLPGHRLYWSQTCRIPQVADSMSRKSHGLDTVQDRHGKHRIAKKRHYRFTWFSWRGGRRPLSFRKRSKFKKEGKTKWEFQEKRKRSQTRPIPQFDVRTDKVGPSHARKNKGRDAKNQTED